MNEETSLPMKHSISSTTIHRLAGSLLLCLLIFIAVATYSLQNVDYRNTDFVVFWHGGQILISGGNPYDPSAWNSSRVVEGSTLLAQTRFLYPLMAAFLFAPMGILPLPAAYFFWIFMTQVCLALSLRLLLQTGGTRPTARILIPVAAGMILFRPTLIILQNGQISGLLLLIISGVIYLWEAGRYRLGGMLLALLALKPNIGLPVIFLLCVWLMHRGQRGAVCSCLSSVLALMFVALLYDHQWISEFLLAGRRQLGEFLVMTPTIPGCVAQVVGSSGRSVLMLGGVAGIFILIVCWLALRRHLGKFDDRTIVSLAVVFTLLLTPYAWPSDQLLLIVPLVTVMLSMQRRGYSFLLYASLPLAVDLLAIILFALSGTIRTENYSVLLTLLLLSLLVWQVRQPGRDNLPILPSREGVPR